jgi:hypothetical protein
MEISTILWILCGIFNACVIFKRVKLDNAINVLLAAMGICMGPFVTLLILISFWASHSSAVEGRKELSADIRERYDELLKSEAK